MRARAAAVKPHSNCYSSVRTQVCPKLHRKASGLNKPPALPLGPADWLYHPYTLYPPRAMTHIVICVKCASAGAVEHSTPCGFLGVECCICVRENRCPCVSQFSSERIGRGADCAKTLIHTQLKVWRRHMSQTGVHRLYLVEAIDVEIDVEMFRYD